MNSMHSCGNCILCALKEFVEQYLACQMEKGIRLSSSALRKELAKYYETLQKFQLKMPADSIEALSAILEFLHFSQVVENHSEDCRAFCIPHMFFHLELVEQYRCECKCSSEVLPWDFCNFTLQVYIEDLVSKTTDSKYLDVSDSEYRKHSETLDSKGKMPEFIHEQLRENWVSICPSEKPCKIQRANREIHILHLPEVLVLNFIWKHKAHCTQTCKTLASLPTHMDSQMFTNGKNENYYMKALVFYNGSHYISYIYQDTWHRCDDSFIRTVNCFKDLVIDVIHENMWPVAVFYDKVLKNYAEVNDEEWADIEKNAILLDIEAEFHKVTAFWSCVCGERNDEYLFYCGNCKKNRFSDCFWVCLKCSSLNNESAMICSSCKTLKINPSSNSFHARLKSQNFYYLTSDPISEKNIKNTKTQHFLPLQQREDTVSQVLFPNSGAIATQSMYFAKAPDLRPYMSQKIHSKSCVRCQKKANSKSPFCSECKKHYIYCETCHRVSKKNGQLCLCIKNP